MDIANGLPGLSSQLVWIFLALLGPSLFAALPAGPHRTGGRV